LSVLRNSPASQDGDEDAMREAAGFDDAEEEDDDEEPPSVDAPQHPERSKRLRRPAETGETRIGNGW